MEIIAIMFWSSVAALALGWLPFVPRFTRWVERKISDRMRQKRVAQRTQKMTQAVKQVKERMDRNGEDAGTCYQGGR